MLNDGSEFHGISFGYPRSTSGEVVFNTGMSGYPESLTDPSYFGQILVLTYPLVGNYGMPSFRKDNFLLKYYESAKARINGLVVNDFSSAYSHWHADTSLAQWLYNQKVPAIHNVDTRALTQKIRESGVMSGKILIDDNDLPFFNPDSVNLVAEVSPSKVQEIGTGKKTVVVVDCGCKYSIINELLKRNVRIKLLPWDFPFSEEKFDGLLISSGPGDPKMCLNIADEIKNVLKKEKPVFGICLGHQLLALSVNTDTYKLKYGHRGQNQPVLDPHSRKAYITSQNHGFAVKNDALPADWSTYFYNLNDQTSEGLIHRSGRFFSTQFHPEASPGPEDTTFLFDKFVKLL